MHFRKTIRMRIREMKKTLISFATATVLAASGVSLSFAQDGSPPNLVPVEMQVCNYKDGKDSDDFDRCRD